jgi:hypothetical protein
MKTKPSNHTPNDHRSIVKNPNSPSYKSNQDNRSRQLNPKDNGGRKDNQSDKKE